MWGVRSVSGSLRVFKGVSGDFRGLQRRFNGSQEFQVVARVFQGFSVGFRGVPGVFQEVSGGPKGFPVEFHCVSEVFLEISRSVPESFRGVPGFLRVFLGVFRGY